MRIITGSQRGKKLTALEGEQVRPTTDRVKESLFNILQFGIEGRRLSGICGCLPGFRQSAGKKCGGYGLSGPFADCAG